LSHTDPSACATAFAPASIGNVAVGYDVLGGVLGIGVGDRVTVRRLDEPVVRVGAVTGREMDLPRDPRDNTATAGLVRWVEENDLDHGFEVSIEKGIPLGSGMGGSAASAVGGVVAANAVASTPLPDDDLFRYALLGEAVASGSIHPDNVAPCFYGGLVLTRAVDPPDVVSIPTPDAIRCVLVHPHRTVETREARQRVPPEIPLEEVVRQTANMGAFVAGCYRNDLDLIGRSLRDCIVEPRRAGLVPGFAEVQSAAMNAGALGCSLAGAGPSLFAWARADDAETVRDAMTRAFNDHDSATDAYISRADGPGARLVEREATSAG
jgi:homoserine kinase